MIPASPAVFVMLGFFGGVSCTVGVYFYMLFLIANKGDK